jgi:uncharacterized protein
VIAYFDTSAVVPLLIQEPTTEQCIRLWDEASRVLTVRLTYPEARAALASAQRAGRLTRSQLTAAVAELENVLEQVDVIEVGADLARTAGELAQRHGLRGYDAVHLGATLAAADDDLVLVTGDADLAAAAANAGLAVARPTD